MFSHTVSLIVSRQKGIAFHFTKDGGKHENKKEGECLQRAQVDCKINFPKVIDVHQLYRGREKDRIAFDFFNPMKCERHFDTEKCLL